MGVQVTNLPVHAKCLMEFSSDNGGTRSNLTVRRRYFLPSGWDLTNKTP